MTKFLIAGLGSIGRRHLRNLVALGEKDIVLLRSHHATLPEEELAGYPVENDLAQALDRHQPDAVIVANPTALHLQVAMPAVEAGCAVLLEKPISRSMEGLDALQAAAKKSGSKILVGFQFRFHPGLLRARQLIQDGEIGRIISAHVYFGEYLPAWHPWEDYRKGYAARAELGGGVVLTQCHSLDYLPWLVGEEVEATWGLTGKLSDLEVDVEDTAEIGLRFMGGALGNLHLDYNQQPPVHYFKIVGTKGSIRWDLSDGATMIYRAPHPLPLPRRGRGWGEGEWETYPLGADWERNVMFRDEIRHFLAVVRSEAEPLATLQDGINVMRLVAAVEESQRSGCLIRV